jgi:hypothetical protein
MSRFSFAAVFAALILALTAGAAEARRSFRVPIVVPGMGGGESLEKVLDLPDIPALQRKGGAYIDLGYLHHRGGKGEWVGYVGSSTRYLKLSEPQLKMLLLIAGLDKLPPVPKRKSSGGSGLMWFVLAIAVFGGGFKFVRGLTKGISRAGQRVARAATLEGQADYSRAHEQIERAAQTRAILSQEIGGGKIMSAARSGPAPASSPQGNHTSRRAAAGGFGRRGL